jgi:hypothetical protein
MKLSILALLAVPAAAYVAPTMTFAVGKKKAPKGKGKKAPAPASMGTVPSKALPFEEAPAALDGSLPGDVGFDPCFLTTKADLMAQYFNTLPFLKDPGLDGLTWYREIELIHGRLAQMAVLGFIFPGLWHIPALTATNPLEAISATPNGGLYQIFAFMGVLELRRIRIINREGSNYQAGDFGWGQGEGRWNPFNFNYSPEKYYEKQVQETKHGRLAMIALVGLYLQASISGVGVIDQLSPAFSSPEYYAKAGYFLPAGI